jgi:prevent-host-death family protein
LLDVAQNMAYSEAMKVANIAEFKDNLSKLIALVERGEVVEIRKRNIPIARLVPLAREQRKNQTKLGCGRGTVEIRGDLTEPLIPEESWETLGS